MICAGRIASIRHWHRASIASRVTPNASNAATVFAAARPASTGTGATPP
jgi:hypothetical protein